MANAVRIFALVISSILTLGAVVAIKRWIEWGLGDVHGAEMDSILALTIAAAAPAVHRLCQAIEKAARRAEPAVRIEILAALGDSDAGYWCSYRKLAICLPTVFTNGPKSPTPLEVVEPAGEKLKPPVLFGDIVNPPADVPLRLDPPKGRPVRPPISLEKSTLLAFAA